MGCGLGESLDLALFTLDGPEGKTWRLWNDHLTKYLLARQLGPGDGCLAGPWEDSSGRVYGTALNALTLEVYYRYAPPGSVEER